MMNNKKEEFITIPGYDNYKVSNTGIVINFKYNRVLNPVSINDYQRVELSKKGSSKYFYVHRLVALAFIDNPGNKNYVNHINSIKSDNRVENLEWVTNQENLLHFTQNNHKLSKQKLNDILTDISKKYNISMDVLNDIASSHLTKNAI